MPVMRKPEWADPAKQSVLDSPMEKALRMLASVLGGTTGADAVGQLTPMTAIATVPKEAVEALVPRLMQKIDEVYGIHGMMTPDKFSSAIRTLARKFPRMMSHIDDVDLMRGPTGTMGEFLPLPNDWNGRAGRILVDPSLSYEELLQTLTHELTHGGQQLRAMSRGANLYDVASEAPGRYFTSPIEVRARTAQINQALKRGAPVNMGSVPSSPGARLKAAEDHALNPFADEWMKR